MHNNLSLLQHLTTESLMARARPPAAGAGATSQVAPALITTHQISWRTKHDIVFFNKLVLQGASVIWVCY